MPFLQLAASLNVTHSTDGKTLEASLFRAAVSQAQGRLGALADDSPGLAAALRRILDEHTRQPGEQSDSTE